MLKVTNSSTVVDRGRESARTVPELVCVSIRAVAQLIDDKTHGRSRLEDWLTTTEMRTFQAFTIPKRRLDWLAGRLAAKEAVRARAETGGRDSFRTIEICPSTSAIDSGRPRYTVHGNEGAFGLSICHAGDTAVAALSCRPEWEIGVDLECVLPRNASLESVALSQQEQHQLGSLEGTSRDRAVTLVWVMKEAILKALGLGLRMPLGQLSVHLERLPDCFIPAAGEASCLAVNPATTGPMFSIDRQVGHLHPLLPKLEQLPMLISTFSLGDALGCWVTLPAEEALWKR